MSASQDDIDDLFSGAQADVANEANADPADTEDSQSAPLEDTAESPSGEEEEKQASDGSMRGIPWVDYIPDPPPDPPTDMQAALELYYIDTNLAMAQRERYMLHSVEEELPEAFKLLCNTYSAEYFRVCARLRRRKRNKKTALRYFREFNDEDERIENYPHDPTQYTEAQGSSSPPADADPFEQAAGEIAQDATNQVAGQVMDPFEQATAAASQETADDPFEQATAAASQETADDPFEQATAAASQEAAGDPVEQAMAEAEAENPEDDSPEPPESTE